MPSTRKPLEQRRDAHQKITPERRAVFLELLAQTGIVSHSAAGASPNAKSADPSGSFRSLRDRDPLFAQEWELAMQRFNDRLEAEAIRRAVEGIPEAIYQKGERVIDHDGSPAVVMRYSDRLLERLLEAKLGREYARKREIEVSGRIAHVGLLLAPSDITCLNDSEREHLRAILHKIGVHRGEIEAKSAPALPPPTDAEFEEVPIDAATEAEIAEIM